MRQIVEQEKEYLISLRRYFHKHPELSKQEYHTAEKIEQELDGIGISHKRIGETGVVASLSHIIDADTAKTIVLRADIDALPVEEKTQVEYKSENSGVMHACGHDAHTAALLGAAKILKAREEALNGTVVFLFQQAEEIGGGAKQFIEAGSLKGADRVFGVHMQPGLPVGTVSVKAGECNASVDYFKITVHGKSAHVSTPHLGVDALYTASQMVVSMQSVIARGLDPLEVGVVGIGKLSAGSSYNIVANEAVLEGTTRAFNAKARAFLNHRVQEIAKTTAQMYGASVEIEFKDYTSPLVNDENVAAEVEELGVELLGREHVLTNQPRNMLGDDFAEYLKEVKGLFLFVGSAGQKETAYPLHHEKFDLDEEAIVIATEFYVGYAEKIVGINKISGEA